MKEVDAKKGGNGVYKNEWYQAFIVKQNDHGALVHFSGFTNYDAEVIPKEDFPTRIRARSDSTSTGQFGVEKEEDVKQLYKRLLEEAAATSAATAAPAAPAPAAPAAAGGGTTRKPMRRN